MRTKKALCGVWVVAIAMGLGCTSEEIVAGDGHGEDEEVSFRVSLLDLEDGLQLHYSGDVLCNQWMQCSVLDISGNGRHGTPNGGVSTVSSPWGVALNFDGVNDWVEIPSAMRNPATFGGVHGDFTVSARVRLDDADKVNRLCKGCAPFGAFRLGTESDGRRVQTVHRDVKHGGNHEYTSDGTIPEGQWMTVTMIGNSGTGVAYQFNCDRGQSVTQYANPDPYSPNYDTVKIDIDIGLADFGESSLGKGGNAAAWFDGRIDDIRVWDRVLSREELAMLCMDPTDQPCMDGWKTHTVDPPIPPSPYTLPVADPESDCAASNCSVDLGCASDSAVACVTDATCLEAAVGAGNGATYDDIILCDGAYNRTAYLQIYGQRLWAEHVSKAVLNFGIGAGGNNGTYNYTGPEIHGLKFDITNGCGSFATV